MYPILLEAINVWTEQYKKISMFESFIGKLKEVSTKKYLIEGIEHGFKAIYEADEIEENEITADSDVAVPQVNNNAPIADNIKNTLKVLTSKIAKSGGLSNFKPESQDVLFARSLFNNTNLTQEQKAILAITIIASVKGYIYKSLAHGDIDLFETFVTEILNNMIDGDNPYNPQYAPTTYVKNLLINSKTADAAKKEKNTANYQQWSPNGTNTTKYVFYKPEQQYYIKTFKGKITDKYGPAWISIPPGKISEENRAKIPDNDANKNAVENPLWVKVPAPSMKEVSKDDKLGGKDESNTVEDLMGENDDMLDEVDFKSGKKVDKMKAIVNELALDNIQLGNNAEDVLSAISDIVDVIFSGSASRGNIISKNEMEDIASTNNLDIKYLIRTWGQIFDIMKDDEDVLSLVGG